MGTVLPYEAFAEQVFQSELGLMWVQDPLLQQDIWPLAALAYTEEECKLQGIKNIYFDRFSLLWLKLLAKLTVKARVRERQCASHVLAMTITLRQLDEFLTTRGYTQPEDLTDAILQQFISGRDRRRKICCLVYAVRLWVEEDWLKVKFVVPKIQLNPPQIEIIPEEVLHQIYEQFDLFPPPLERLFRLQLALGCRIGEVLKMPRICLKQEEEQWFLLRWIEKIKQWRFYRIHPKVAELVQEQQQFLDTHFGTDLNFDKLFCWLSTNFKHGVSGGYRFEVEPVYRGNILSYSQVNGWLKAFSDAANLRDKQGNHFLLKSHMFRRTRASIMAYCEIEDEYIAAVLGHVSLDMLPHYRKRSLERLEKEAQTKGYVDMYGKVTTFKPRKRRYERLSALLKVSTPLGECHRPSMLGDCKHRYACLDCVHHRVTLEDRPQLEADRDLLQQDLQQAKMSDQERRLTEIQRLLNLINSRLMGLTKLENLLEKHPHV